MQEVIVPLYLADLYTNPPDAHRLHVSLLNTHGSHCIQRVIQYIFTCLSDCVPIMKCSKHLEAPDVLLSVFEQEMDNYLTKVSVNCVRSQCTGYLHVQEILDKLCKEIETDLRFSSHLHLQLDDRNPFKVWS